MKRILLVEDCPCHNSQYPLEKNMVNGIQPQIKQNTKVQRIRGRGTVSVCRENILL
jgi:hypothetical protein